MNWARHSEIGFGSFRRWYVKLIVRPPNLHNIRIFAIEINCVLLSLARINLQIIGVAGLISEGQMEESTTNSFRPLTINEDLVFVNWGRCFCKQNAVNRGTIISNNTVAWRATIDSSCLIYLHPHAFRRVWTGLRL